MSARNLVVWAAVVAVLAAIALSVPPDERSGYFIFGGGALAIVLASTWVLSQRRFITYVEANSKRVKLLGWTIAGTAAVSVIGYSWLAIEGAASIAPMQVVLESMTLMGLAGVMIASFPRMATQVERARAKAEVLKAQPVRAVAFSPLAEGGRAALTILRSPAVFLQITGPWVVILAAGYFAFTTYSDRLKAAGAALGLLLLIFAWLAVFLLSIPTIGVAWARWIGQGQRPDRFVALPDRAVLSVMWRLWIFNLVAGGAADRISAWVAGHAKTGGMANSDSLGVAANAVVGILAVVLAGPFAVRLAARALGDKEFRIFDLGPLRRLGPKLGLGLALSMAPAGVLTWLLDPLYEALPHSGETIAHPGSITLAWLAVGLILLLAVVASGAAYLTRVYRAANSRT